VKILRLPEVLDRTGYKSQSTLWRLEAAGKFPARIQVGPNSVGWDEEEVDAWLKSRPRAAVGRRSSAAPRSSAGAVPKA
jgi:predicted DNA-binding transcriptional regulator AlpA